MASQAEVDLVISTAGTLPDLERDLDRILRIAENDADAVNVQAGIDSRTALRQMERDLTNVIDNVEGRIDGVEVGALIEQREVIRTLTRQVDQIVDQVGNTTDPVTIQGVLDSAQTLRTVRAELERVARNVEQSIDPIEIEAEIDRDRVRDAARGLRNIAQTAGEAALSVGRLGLSVGTAGVAIGAIVPLLAGVAAAAQQVAPAAAVATSGMLALALAGGTVKLAMQGVSEAIETAFDPDAKPEDLEKALKKLAPEARKFVVELRGMRKGLKQVQQEVQNRFFKDFDETLRGLSRSVLPPLRKGLNDTADTLNEMARGAADAAKELADNGTLGKAVDGATKGLDNLKRVPAQIVTSLGQLAAASAPALDKLTRRIDSKSTEIADKLTKAFESKKMEDAINRAIDTIGQLFDSVGNVLSGIGNIFNGLTQEGRGLFDILEELTQAFEDLTASKEFQLILGELAKTADTLIKNVLPLLQEAFVQLAPVIAELAPVVREFIDEIGPELIPLLQELGPVLLDIARILKENLPLAILIAKGVIGVLVLALRAIHFILENIVLPTTRKFVKFITSDFFNALSIGNVIVGLFTGQTEQRFRKMAPGVGAGIKEAKRIIEGWAADLGNRILGMIQRAVDGIARRFFRLVGEIRDSIGRLPGQMISIGANIINGLIRGITGSVAGLMNIVRGIANRITATLKDALSIASPSRVMADIGEDTVAGLVVGLKRMTPQVEDAMSGISALVSPSFALPDGQTLRLPQATTGDTQVTVMIGNEQFKGYIRTEINANNRTQDRVLSQGGGRR